MRCTVVAIGLRMPAWVQEGWREYARRFSQGLSLELLEVAPPRRGRNANISAIQAEEGAALLGAAGSSARIVALDERGAQWSTADLAQRLQHWINDGRDVAFLVGGPDGLPGSCRDCADETWSLSRLTFPHPLVRVILAEQLYRAWSLLRNHPYHRE